jgi:hypothetical protein
MESTNHNFDHVVAHRGAMHSKASIVITKVPLPHEYELVERSMS